MSILPIVFFVVVLLLILRMLQGKRPENNQQNRVPRRSGTNNNLTSQSTSNKDWRKKTIVISYELIDKVGLLAEAQDLYVVSVVKSDEEEKKKMQHWENLALSLGLHKKKIVFCETTQGLSAIIRQIQPQLILLSWKEQVTTDFLKKLPSTALSATIGSVKSLDKFESVFEKCTGEILI